MSYLKLPRVALPAQLLVILSIIVTIRISESSRSDLYHHNFCLMFYKPKKSPHWQSPSIHNGDRGCGPCSTPKCKLNIVSIAVVCCSVELFQNSNMTAISVVKTLVHILSHIWSTLAYIEGRSWIDRPYQPCESVRRN